MAPWFCFTFAICQPLRHIESCPRGGVNTSAWHGWTPSSVMNGQLPPRNYFDQKGIISGLNPLATQPFTVERYFPLPSPCWSLNPRLMKRSVPRSTQRESTNTNHCTLINTATDHARSMKNFRNKNETFAHSILSTHSRRKTKQKQKHIRPPIQQQRNSQLGKESPGIADVRVLGATVPTRKETASLWSVGDSADLNVDATIDSHRLRSHSGAEAILHWCAWNATDKSQRVLSVTSCRWSVGFWVCWCGCNVRTN